MCRTSRAVAVVPPSACNDDVLFILKQLVLTNSVVGVDAGRSDKYDFMAMNKGTSDYFKFSVGAHSIDPLLPAVMVQCETSRSTDCLHFHSSCNSPVDLPEKDGLNLL